MEQKKREEKFNVSETKTNIKKRDNEKIILHNHIVHPRRRNPECIIIWHPKWGFLVDFKKLYT